MSSDKVVLIHSGGLDSTVCLYMLRAGGRDVWPLTFNYGQRHRRELDAAYRICKEIGLDPRREVVDISFLGSQIMQGSSQTTPGVDVPQGHYADDTMKTTVVPNRNMVMLALAGAYAISKRIPTLIYAAHTGDHAIYPDCRPPFVEAMQGAFKLCNFTQVNLEAPFLFLTKADIVKHGLTLRVPFQHTRSCYQNRLKSCGRCGTCVERLEAFSLAGAEDPLPYEDRDFWKTVTGKGQGPGANG